MQMIYGWDVGVRPAAGLPVRRGRAVARRRRRAGHVAGRHRPRPRPRLRQRPPVPGQHRDRPHRRLPQIQQPRLTARPRSAPVARRPIRVPSRCRVRTVRFAAHDRVGRPRGPSRTVRSGAQTVSSAGELFDLVDVRRRSARCPSRTVRSAAQAVSSEGELFGLERSCDGRAVLGSTPSRGAIADDRYASWTDFPRWFRLTGRSTMRSPLPAEVLAQARAQYGLVTRAQLDDAKVSTRHRTYLFEGRFLVPVHKGVYRLGSHDVGFEQTCLGRVPGAARRSWSADRRRGRFTGCGACRPDPVHLLASDRTVRLSRCRDRTSPPC